MICRPLLQNRAQLVELGVKSPANHARLVCQGGWIVGNASCDHVAHVRQLVHLFAKLAQAARAGGLACAQPASAICLEQRPQRRNLLERPAQRQQVARRGDAQRDPARQPFEIENAFEFLANFLARHGLRFQLRDRVQPLLDLLERNFRPQDPARSSRAPMPVAVSSMAPQQRGRGVVARRRLDQFQVPHRHLIENHGVLLLVVGDAVQMLESRARRTQRRHLRRVLRVARADGGGLAQVVNDRAGRRCRLRVPRQAESFERHHAKLLLQLPRRVVALENPFVQPRSTDLPCESHSVGVARRRREKAWSAAPAESRAAAESPVRRAAAPRLSRR